MFNKPLFNFDLYKNWGSLRTPILQPFNDSSTPRAVLGAKTWIDDTLKSVATDIDRNVPVIDQVDVGFIDFDVHVVNKTTFLFFFFLKKLSN